jgi:hypothetical protein
MNEHFKENGTRKRLGKDKAAYSHLDWVVMVLVLLLPLFTLYWMVPFVGEYTIGNDYLNYWINNQMFLRFSLSNGTFPLYAPGFNGGWTSSALTLGQLYHPNSWLAAIVPGYWDGYAHQIGTIIRLAELGGTCAVIFLFLRKLRLEIPFAFVLSFITVYNLRMLDMFRYGASLENYTAMLLLCTALGWFYLSTLRPAVLLRKTETAGAADDGSPKNRLLPFCIAICSWLLVVGGHPQMMYIGFLGAVFVCIFFPFYASCLLPEHPPLEFRMTLKFWGLSALSMFLGILLASPYTFPFYFEYLRESSRGSGINFAGACAQQDTLGGILCNFFNPFFSEVHGSFGGSSLILLAVLFPLVGIFYIRRAWPVFVLWAGCVVILIMAAGSNGPLYYYFWKYFPFAQTFRVPGRLCTVLPFMFMLILVWMFRQRTVRLRLGRREISFDPVVPALAVALILFIVPKGFDYASLTASGRYVPASINKVPSIAVSLFFISGLICLATMILYRISNKLRTFAVVALVAFVLIGTTVTMRFGTWIAPGHRKTETFSEMRLTQKQRLAYRYPTGDWSRSIIEEHLKHTFLEPALARFCRKYEVVGSRQESYQRLAKLREIDLAYVDGWPRAKGESKAADSSGDIDRVELRYSSFNNLIFDVVCAQAGFFVFSFPYSSQWQAKNDGQDAPIYRCNVLEQGVWLAPGKHSVEFRYRSPAATAGAVLGCLALVAVVWSLFSNSGPAKIRWVALTVTIILSALLLTVWYLSLYQGGNTGTHYLWTSRQIQPNLSSDYNLAYGKKTSMSNAGVESYLTDGSLGVDGDREGFFGFLTNTQGHAWWQVDLDNDVPIGEIVVYKMRSGYSRFAIPFDVMFSQDGKNWSRISTVETDTADNCWRIRVPGINTHYVRLQTRSVALLALSEVEVYRQL